MKVVFGNQKGGVGKSTLCVMLANYLTLVKKKGSLNHGYGLSKNN